MTILLLLLFILSPIQVFGIPNTTSPPSLALPGCRDKCGSITVPYPFGLADGCSRRDANLLLTCSNNSMPPRLLLTIGVNDSCISGPFVPPSPPAEPSLPQPPPGPPSPPPPPSLPPPISIPFPEGLNNNTCLNQVLVTNITFDSLTISYKDIAMECIPPPDDVDKKNLTIFELGDLPYTLSASRNRLTVIGCDSLGLFSVNNESFTGCLSFCSNTSIITNGTCAGEGCCQTALGKKTKRLAISLSSVRNHTTTGNISNCSVAFPVDQDWFRFSYENLRNFTTPEVPVVLEWAIGNQTCERARRYPDFACIGGKGRTRCVDAESSEGYRCYCIHGYEGNPYLKDGCKDIDECSRGIHGCSDLCKNTVGGYRCLCPNGTSGDGLKNGKGCVENPKYFEMNNAKFPKAAILGIGIGSGIVAVLLIATWLRWLKHKRDYIKLKEEYFKNNGGLLLREGLASTTGDDEAARLFSEDELKIATAGFSQKRILGRGANGEVYMGILPDKRLVAIKKSTQVDQMQVEQFVNEIKLLSKVVHRNVVKLVGCCLETKIPLLVYEYVPNGTLFEHIHEAVAFMPWPLRLRIAAETASAIAHLHSGIETPIIHRDIKSANILLSSDFTAKVADFGASRLAPHNEQEEATLVLGTRGYLDPEYFETGLFSDKSDVYSYGVVAAELLTGMKAIIYTERGCLSLAAYILEAMKNGRITEIIDGEMDGEYNLQQVSILAEIVKRCLERNPEKRPTMSEVAAELVVLRGRAEDQ